jgi:hypothetical protein
LKEDALGTLYGLDQTLLPFSDDVALDGISFGRTSFDWFNDQNIEPSSYDVSHEIQFIGSGDDPTFFFLHEGTLLDEPVFDVAEDPVLTPALTISTTPAVDSPSLNDTSSLQSIGTPDNSGNAELSSQRRILPRNILSHPCTQCSASFSHVKALL